MQLDAPANAHAAGPSVSPMFLSIRCCTQPPSASPSAQHSCAGAAGARGPPRAGIRACPALCGACTSHPLCSTPLQVLQMHAYPLAPVFELASLCVAPALHTRCAAPLCRCCRHTWTPSRWRLSSPRFVWRPPPHPLRNTPLQVLQTHVDPLAPAFELGSFCLAHGIQLEAYSSLGTQWPLQQPGNLNPVLAHPGVKRLEEHLRCRTGRERTGTPYEVRQKRGTVCVSFVKQR
eukprot:364225-Chlamydomonas_euryale.AAC.6